MCGPLDLTYHEPPDSYENTEYNIPTTPVLNNQAPTYAMGVIEDDTDQDLNDQSQHCSCFGKKFKKTVGTAIVVNLIGIAMFISGIMLIIGRGGDPTRTKLRKKNPPNFGETTKKLTFYSTITFFTSNTALKQFLKVVLSNFHQKQTFFMIFGRLLGGIFLRNFVLVGSPPLPMIQSDRSIC